MKTGEFSARKGCATQWPSWEISTSVTKSHFRPVVLFHDVAFHDVVRSRFVLSALAYLSQTADRPVVDLRGGTAPPTRRTNFHFFAMLIFFYPEFCLGR